MDIDPASIQGSGMVLFYVPWCGHCKRFLPEFEKMAAKHTSTKFYKVNMDLYAAPRWLTGGEEIRSVPKVSVFDAKLKKSKMYVGALNERALMSCCYKN
jgi:thioredoxin-like negative regulator of GroEL